MSRQHRQRRCPKHLDQYILGSDDDENITFIPPKPKMAKLNDGPKVFNTNEVPNAGALVDRGTPPKIAKPSEAFYQTSSSDEDENTGNLLALWFEHYLVLRI